MKEIVIHLREKSLKINADFFAAWIAKPLFLLFIYFGLYSRTEGLFGLSGGMVSVLITFALFITCSIHFFFINKENKISNFAGLVSLFFILSALIPLLSYFVFETYPMGILRYSVETAINFTMFFSIYYFIREQLISPKYFIYSIAIMALIASLIYLSNIFGQIKIRRLSGMGGSNYLGSSFAMGAFTWMIIIYFLGKNNPSRLKKTGVYVSFMLVLLSLLLTGTRAASVAFVTSIILFQLVGMQSKKFTKYALYSILVFMAIVFIISLNVDLSLLWGRYSFAQIERMAGIRFEIYYRSVADLTWVEYLFGRPDLYLFGEGVSLDRKINPHNIFLGIIRFNGLIPFLLFVIIFVMILYKCAVLYVIHRDKTDYRVFESSIIILFIVVLIYTLLSGGRITRSFAFFIVLGYAIGYFDLFKSIRSYDEYDKLLF